MSSGGTESSLPVVVIGAGLAGLTVALHLADQQPVIVLAKRHLEEAATAGPRAASWACWAATITDCP